VRTQPSLRFPAAHGLTGNRQPNRLTDGRCVASHPHLQEPGERQRGDEQPDAQVDLAQDQ
jgi:hypothetical protein